MRAIAVGVSLIAFMIPAIAQQILELKSSERLNGSCKGLSADSVSFDFKGAVLRFPTSDIRAIYFDASTAPTVQNASKSQQATVSGVLTYFFNSNYGDKPDIGSSIYIMDSTKLNGLDVGKIFKFQYGASYRRMAEHYKARKDDIPVDVATALVEYGVETEAKYKQLEEEATDAFLRLTVSKDVVKLTADGNGAFSKELQPGSYYVVMQSKHRQSLNMIEVNGSIEYRPIKLEPGQQKDMSFSFPATEI